MTVTQGTLRILHLGDLFFHRTLDVRASLTRLLDDLCGPEPGLGLEGIDLIVACGDFSWQADPVDLAACCRFFQDLTSALDLDMSDCLLVPGNHDVDWSYRVYDHWPISKDLIDETPTDLRYIDGKTLFILKQEDYPRRFGNFAEHLYKPLIGRSYPLEPSKQYQLFHHKPGNVCLLGLNSCERIDRFYNRRAGLNPLALADALRAARHENASLRIACWHHPVSGKDGLENESTVEQLISAGFRLFLHGHVHGDRRQDFLRNVGQTWFIGAGCFNRALIRGQVRVRLYNLIEWDADKDQVQVHQRIFNIFEDRWLPWK